MMILAFETSGPTASVALMKNGSLIAEHTLHHTRTHSETALPMAEALMRELQISPNELTALAVNQGPGSFTGVRIGICSANAMAYALRIPVYGVDSLSALYQNVAFYEDRICVLIDARNESVYAAQFERGKCVSPLYAGRVEEYLKAVPPHTLFLGDGAHAYGELIRATYAHAKVLDAAFSLSRASALCYAAKGRIQAGDAGEPDVEPIYLRPSQAERMWLLRNPGEGENANG